jgi:transcriptional regulator with XRE-family HTH domain
MSLHSEPPTFAELLKSARKRTGMSQADVSRQSGIHVTEVSRMERGLRDPRLSTIYRLADGLGMKPSELLS